MTEFAGGLNMKEGRGREEPQDHKIDFKYLQTHEKRVFPAA